MSKTVIYTKPHCPYCVAALRLLNKKGAQIEEIVASSDHSLRREMNEKSGRNTFPQIFIDGKHIGGCDDLYELDAMGGLDPLLAK